MIKAFSTAVQNYQNHMDDCKVMYVEALCDDFIHTCIHEESTIDDLNHGFNTYQQSLHNFVEFKSFCKHMNHHNYNVQSKTYLRVVKNTFKQMRKEFNDPYVLKSFTNKHSTLGHKLNEFMKLCTRWYIDCSLLTPRILYDKEIFHQFCTTINSNMNTKQQVNMNSNLFEVYFDDYYSNLFTNAQQVKKELCKRK